MAFDSSNTIGYSQNIAQLERSYYKELAEDRLFQNLVLYPLGKHEKLPMNAGGTFVFNRWGNVTGTTATLNEDTVTGGQVVLTANTASITLAPYGQFAKITEFAQMTSRREVTEDATLLLMDGSSDTVDQLIRTELLANAGTFVGVGNAKTTATLSAADTWSGQIARQIVSKLRANRVRPFRDSQKYAGVLHDFQIYDLQSDTNVGGFLTTAQYSQPTKIWNGEVGAIMGLRVLSSQNVLTATLATGISTLTAYTGFVLGESSFATVDLANDDAIDIIINKPGSAGAADPYRNIATVAYKMYFGVRYLSGSILADFNSANRALAVTMCVTFNG